MIEEYRDIEGYEGLYQVSNLGNVKSLTRMVYNGHNYYSVKEKILKPGICNKGYKRNGLSKDNKQKHYATHRLVATAFIPNPEGKPQVNHINGIKDDNRIENLEWNTASENVIHAFDTGLRTKLKGVKHNMVKLTEKDVLEIRASNKTNKILGETYGVSETTVSAVKHRKTWTHI